MQTKSSLVEKSTARVKEEFIYRKQILRQLGTQYVEGIYSNSLTLKSGLEVTQGHRKWHHLIDRMRSLSISVP